MSENQKGSRKERGFFDKICVCFKPTPPKKKNKVKFESPTAIQVSTFRSNPDYNANNIKGVILRIQEYKGRNGLKKHCNENMLQVQEDYFIMKDFLETEKSKNPKFQTYTDMITERIKNIDIYTNSRGLTLNREGVIHQDESKKSKLPHK